METIEIELYFVQATVAFHYYSILVFIIIMLCECKSNNAIIQNGYRLSSFRKNLKPCAVPTAFID